METINFDTFINIVKRQEQILYKTKVGPLSANIAFVGGESLSSGANISIENLSEEKHVNRIYENEVFNFENILTLEIQNKNFLLTDVYTATTSSGSIIKIPLFFKHQFNLGTGETVKTSSIRIYDDLDTEISLTETKTTTSHLYSNIESFYSFIGDGFVNSSSTEYKFYRIEYTIQTSSGQVIRNELLNNIPVFSEATVDDLDLSDSSGVAFSSLTAGSKIYAISETQTGFLIDLFSEKNVSYKIKDNQKLKVFPPTSKNYTDPWHLRVPNNEVNDGGTVYKVSGDQFASQNFNPIIGIKRVDKEIPTLINKRIIKTDFENLKEDTDLSLYIRVRIQRGTTTSYYSTNPSEGGSYVLWSLASPTGIKGIDSRTGFIELDGIDLLSTDKLECDYYYTEAYYELTELDFNPIRNSSILERKTVVYIDPNPTGDSTVLYKQFKLDDEPLISGDTYTEWKAANSDHFLLANITVGESKGISDLISLDTRVEGGGIKESKISEVEENYPDYDGTWGEGSFDGKPYPGNLCYHLEVPISGVIKDVDDGIHVLKEIKTIAGRHTALGVYIAARVYGAEVDITDIDMSIPLSSSTVSAKVHWLGVDTYRYKIYYKKTEDSTWTVLSTAFDPGSTNEVISHSGTVTGLVKNTKYHFIVIGGTGTHADFQELITQHISDSDTKLQLMSDNPDLAKVLEVETLKA